MATDPSDLVIDPTCGSGTTATVAEQWGRRWITIDTSRVALALARARIIGARYPYYLLADSREGAAKEAELQRSLGSQRMAGLQRTKSKRKRSGKGKSPEYLFQKQFSLGDGRRVTIRFSAIAVRDAETASGHIDRLLSANKYGAQFPPETMAWLRFVPEKIVDRLVTYGLCPMSNYSALPSFVTDFILRKQVDSAPRTIIAFRQVEKLLNEFFPSRTLVSIRPQDAMAFWHFMRTTKRLGENTTKRRFGRCREICSEAMELERISGNPFALRSIKVSVGAASKIYVPQETLHS